MTAPAWPAIADEPLVGALIPAVQRAIVEICAASAGTVPGVDETTLPAPEVGNVLLMILATILKDMPACATPRGVRLLGEAAGRELVQLVRDARGIAPPDGGGLH